MMVTATSSASKTSPDSSQKTARTPAALAPMRQAASSGTPKITAVQRKSESWTADIRKAASMYEGSHGIAGRSRSSGAE